MGAPPLTGSIAWFTEGSASDQMPWCRAVGPVLVLGPSRLAPPPSLPSLSDVAIVSWNVHVGGGDIDALIRNLRAGGKASGSADHFILLLQEVFRAGPDVPRHPGSDARWARRVAPGPAERVLRSIDSVAARNRLYLFYVPSMRNGHPDQPSEDRGNAILSTLPLLGLEALELPVERQRRVVVSAKVSVLNEEGEPMELRLVNLHLAPRSRWREFYRSLGSARTEQAQVVVNRYGQEPVVVVAGDLNTWFGGPGEGAVQVLREAFPEKIPADRPRTLSNSGPLPDLVLDYIFFRPPPGFSTSYSVLEGRFGSDHHPVIGRFQHNPE